MKEVVQEWWSKYHRYHLFVMIFIFMNIISGFFWSDNHSDVQIVTLICLEASVLFGMLLQNYIDRHWK